MKKKLAVLLSFMVGSTWLVLVEYPYDGSRFANRHDVIVVTFNYRLDSGGLATSSDVAQGNTICKTSGVQ